MTRAKIRVTLKPTVLDAQGAVIEQSLRSLGYEDVRQVRMGKYIELDVAGDGDPSPQVHEMCKRLLTNPIIESYAFDLERVAEAESSAGADLSARPPGPLPPAASELASKNR